MSVETPKNEEEAIEKTYDLRVTMRLLRYLKPYWQLATVALVLTLLTNILGQSTAVFYKDGGRRFHHAEKNRRYLAVFIRFFLSVFVSVYFQLTCRKFCSTSSGKK